MNVHTDLSFLTLITQASIVVQAVMLLLVGLSLWSWWQIFQKMFQLAASKRDADRFEDEFWKGGDLAELFRLDRSAATARRASSALCTNGNISVCAPASSTRLT